MVVEMKATFRCGRSGLIKVGLEPSKLLILLFPFNTEKMKDQRIMTLLKSWGG